MHLPSLNFDFLILQIPRDRDSQGERKKQWEAASGPRTPQLIWASVQT